MAKHPHAELMKLYAEDAMTTTEPWELWEVRLKGDPKWIPMGIWPTWSPDCEYRHKPKTVKIDGVEFPEPYVPFEIISSGRVFYTIDVFDKGIGISAIKRYSSNHEKFDDLLKRGLIFKQSEDCERYIEALSKLNNKIIEYFNQ